MRIAITATAVLIGLWATGIVCHADELRQKDGTVLRGRVISEQADSVTFETSSHGITVRERIPRAQIAAVVRDVAEGPGFCLVPIAGEIGVDVTADVLRTALDEARQAKARYVILVLDSPGGRIDEMAKIVELLGATRDMKVIAYVRKALSASAVIAMACPTIYMHPDATIGAAVPYKVGPAGTPQLIEEKFQSAIRAGMRAAATQGGHGDLLMRGMMDGDLELSLAKVGERSVVVENASGKVIKRKGQILALTASEALEYGLSSGTLSTDESALREALGIKAWHTIGDGPWSTVANRAAAVRLEMQTQQEKRQRLAARGAYIERVRPELTAIERSLGDATARAAAASEAITRLQKQWHDEVAKANSQYQTALRQAAVSRDVVGERNRAQTAHDEQVAKLNEQYQGQIAAIETQRDKATHDASQLVERQKEITAALPPD
ncbi:MAG: hypothetical protein ACHRHE_06595 [Tepidisphaerales bacterium]